jgi:group I intron endonuclease
MLHKKIQRKKSGIYLITNLLNNKKYVGSSVNIYNRYHTHKIKLKQKIHSNKHLEASYHKYGADNFIFEILEYCEKTELEFKEQYYIDFLKPEYNKRLQACNNFGLKIKDVTKIKISNTLKLKNKFLKKAGLPTLNPLNKDKEVSVTAYNLNGEKIKVFNSIYNASRWLTNNTSCADGISCSCKRLKNRNVVHGYQWRYTSDNLDKIEEFYPKETVVFYNENEVLIFNSIPKAQIYFNKSGLHKTIKKGFWKQYKVKIHAQYKSDKLLENPNIGQSAANI